MRPASYTLVGSPVEGAPIIVDTYIVPPFFGYSVLVEGDITWNSQYTLDDVFAEGYDPSAGLWAEIDQDQTASLPNGRIEIAIIAFRVITTAGTGSVLVRFTQAGMPGA